MSEASASPVHDSDSTSNGAVATADLLATIIAATRRIVEVRQERMPIAELASRAAALPERMVRFDGVLRRAEGVNVIAECKRRSQYQFYKYCKRRF